MNKIITKLAVAASLAGVCLGTSSCGDELDQYPIDNPSFGSFWNDQTVFTTNIYALSNMFRNNYVGNITFWAGELRAGTLDINLINGSGALNENYINNIYDAAHAQFSTFGGYYGFIAGLNELIYESERAEESVLPTNVKNGLLGMAYGWRAFCYFQMYRMYGGVPLRTVPEVILGETNSEALMMARSTAQETLDFIKADIDRSLEGFNNTTWKLNNKTAYYWNKATTEMLAGEVYLWSAKVATGDHQLGGAADVEKAKGFFENVVNNYGFQLVDNFASVFTTPLNKEAIYSICYSSLDDKAQNTHIQNQMLWSKFAGAGTDAWSKQDATGLGVRTDGAVSKFQYYTTSGTQPNNGSTQYTAWTNLNPSPNRYMYKNAMYFQYDPEDTRVNMWFPQWEVLESEAKMTYFPNFDPTKRTMIGSFVLKYMPSIVAGWANTYVFNTDVAIYRLPLAYLYLAEVANYQGRTDDVEKYINMVRKRAYGDNWDEELFAYKAGSFRENENAILREKDKEFLMEGQRWWDIRRLTSVKDGSQTDHFVFQPESCAGYGLDPVACSWYKDGKGNAIETATPVLPTNEEYKLLWPIDVTLLGSDKKIEQNPGY